MSGFRKTLLLAIAGPVAAAVGEMLVDALNYRRDESRRSRKR